MGFRLTAHFVPDKIERKQKGGTIMTTHFYIGWALFGTIALVFYKMMKRMRFSILWLLLFAISFVSLLIFLLGTVIIFEILWKLILT